jgi:integrase
VRLLAAAEDSREPELAVAFRLLASLGGRRGEVCGLRWADVDLDGGVGVIRGAVKQLTGQLIVGDAKTHQQRTLLLDEGTMAVLRAHRTMLENRAAALGAMLVTEAYVLTDSPDGAQPWQPNRLTQALRRLRDKAGYTGRLHDLRHWNASQLLGAGESAVVVAARLGHRDPSTTHRWYAHAMPRADARAAALMNEALRPRSAVEPTPTEK